MDPADLRFVPVPAGSGSASPCKELGGKVALDGAAEAVKPGEVCGSQPVVGLGEPRARNLESSDQVQACLRPCNKKDFPQVNAEEAPKHADKVSSLPQAGRFLRPEVACLTLGHAPNATPMEKLHHINPSVCDKENIKKDFQSKPDEKPEENRLNARGLGLDLNVADTLNVTDHNPFFPYKKLGQSKASDPSECGSTTGPIGESESHRKWREMKQNGFLSSSHGSAMVPKPRGRPKRKRDEELRKNSSTQNEQTNKFTKVAAPSGLLSGLNPGIINHVRNSKQVYSIIKAMVHSEKLESENQQVFISQTGERANEVSERTQEHRYGGCLTKCHFMSKDNNRKLQQGLPTASKFLQEDDDDNLKLQLSSAVTLASEKTSSTSADDLASNHDYMTSLSVKAASVASQWLELLLQDIRGRLAALKRSRKRVRNAIHTELPYLISTEFSSSQESETSIAHSSDAGSSEKAVSQEHVAQWKSLFLQMDKALQEEGKHLENRLRQVQEMQLNCDKGLKHTTCETPLLGPMPELWKPKKSEISEGEWAVQAAAASIYSTCNLIMRTENVPCF